MLPKNIIVCADGTGNKGGYSPDSNVYKVYKMVDKHYKGACTDGVEIDEQILFYDNGVGTQTNKIWRAISGAFGLGFRRNVCDLYKFLARNYVEGDRIYFFGFSRGASTVRACNGMISKCGLAKGQGLRNKELDDLVSEAYSAYEVHRKAPEIAEAFKNNSKKSSGAVPIKFLGVWDTVVALGFPKRTDITGFSTFLITVIFTPLEKLFNLIYPHSFYHYKLSDNVEYACQALAIDDERTAFWPHVWREKNIKDAQDRTPDNVEQVWFAGMHSNVGGGYERAGMAGVPLYWMMRRAQHHGLMFIDDTVQHAYDDSHIHGRMYDSRSGFAMLYRYHPREMKGLCDERLLGNIRIHQSVFERLMHRTANYAPGHIPDNFDVVDDEIPSNIVHCNPGSGKDWDAVRNKIDTLVKQRKSMYGVMLGAVLTVMLSAIYLWVCPPVDVARDGFWGNVADILDYFSPDMFDGLISVAIMQRPYLVITALVLVIVYLRIRYKLHQNYVSACEDFRHILIEGRSKS